MNFYKALSVGRYTALQPSFGGYVAVRWGGISLTEFAVAGSVGVWWFVGAYKNR